jgi:hypothetical protein
MTLLESLVALVILGLSAVATLAALESSASSASHVDEWLEAVARAEALMEATKLGPEALALVGSAVSPSGLGHETTVAPWPGVPGVDVITVAVELPRGGQFTLSRLVRAP